MYTLISSDGTVFNQPWALLTTNKTATEITEHILKTYIGPKKQEGTLEAHGIRNKQR